MYVPKPGIVLPHGSVVEVVLVLVLVVVLVVLVVLVLVDMGTVVIVVVPTVVLVLVGVPDVVLVVGVLEFPTLVVVDTELSTSAQPITNKKNVVISNDTATVFVAREFTMRPLFKKIPVLCILSFFFRCQGS